MNKFRKKYQNVVERKNLLTVISKDHNTIDSLESQALDAFYVEASNPEYFMQRMGQLYIKPIEKRRYNLNYYQNQAKLLVPGSPRKISTKTQKLDRFIIKQKQKPKNIVQKPVYFDIIQKAEKPLIEEKLDSFTCEKERKIYHTIQSLNGLKIPAAGKFFNNHPTLKNINILEMEYLKIKAPLKCSEPTTLLIPLKPKKIKFTNEEIQNQSSSNLNYLITKLKVFSPAATTMKSMSPLLIPRQPKKTSFKEIIPNQQTNVFYDIKPKKKAFNEVIVESITDVFIPEQPKKRYYSAMNIESMSIQGTPDYCLEIDPNEEIFIPNVYDMLLIQNYWDDLEIRSFRVCLRPPGYIGRSNKNIVNMKENMKYKDDNEIKENKGENEEKDVLKEFYNNHEDDLKKKKKEEVNDTNLYEDRNKDENKENNREEIKIVKEEKPKKKRFSDLKKTLFSKHKD